MVKKTEEVKDEKNVNQPEGAPIAPEGPAGVTASRETLSHQWQANSPALNTNVLAGYGSQENIVEKFKADEELANKKPEKEKKEKLSDAEYFRRTKLDVSDPEYINPSLDHVESK